MAKTQNITDAAFKIEEMGADQWDSLMATTEAQTPKQKVLKAFEALQPNSFLIVTVAEGRTQEQFVQDVSVFLGKKKYDAKMKAVRKHPTDPTKIVVKRLA